MSRGRSSPTPSHTATGKRKQATVNSKQLRYLSWQDVSVTSRLCVCETRGASCLLCGVEMSTTASTTLPLPHAACLHHVPRLYPDTYTTMGHTPTPHVCIPTHTHPWDTYRPPPSPYVPRLYPDTYTTKHTSPAHVHQESTARSLGNIQHIRHTS